MLIPAASLTLDALDWAVAKSLLPEGQEKAWLRDRQRGYTTCFSRRWTDGGWLLEECVARGMRIERAEPTHNPPKFQVTLDEGDTAYHSDALLEAVCRCYVAYRLGREVDIPAEVLALSGAAEVPAKEDMLAKLNGLSVAGIGGVVK